MLLVFIAEMIVERGDELIDLYCKAILNAERHARQAVKDQREKTARARDERSNLAGTLARILLDAARGGEDPLARALREVGEQRLRAAVEDPGALAKPIDEQRRDALGSRHSHLAQFAPALLAALDLRAARGYQPLLDAIDHVSASRSLRVLGDAKLEVLPAAWRAWTLDEDGRPLRTRYELALWLVARDALRSRGLYRARSHRYGDPLGWMMPQAQWQREREGLAVIFDRPLDPNTRAHVVRKRSGRGEVQTIDASARRWRSVIAPTVLVSAIPMSARNLLQRVVPQRRWLVNSSAIVMLAASHGHSRMTMPTVVLPSAMLRLSSARASRTAWARCSAIMCAGAGALDVMTSCANASPNLRASSSDAA